MDRDLLRVFEQFAVQQEGRDPSRAERVVAQVAGQFCDPTMLVDVSKKHVPLNDLSRRQNPKLDHSRAILAITIEELAHERPRVVNRAKVRFPIQKHARPVVRVEHVADLRTEFADRPAEFLDPRLDQTIFKTGFQDQSSAAFAATTR